MKTMLLIQGLFYFVTGLWPLVHLRSFEAVTGPKTDKWLVQAMGMMITCSALVFLHGALINPSFPIDVFLLAELNCLALAAVDIYFVQKGVISRVYLLDAAVELAIAIFYFVNFPWEKLKL